MGESNVTKGIKNIEKAILDMHKDEDTTEVSIRKFYKAMSKGIDSNEQFIIPVEMPNNPFEKLSMEDIKIGDEFSLEEDLRMPIRIVTLETGEMYLPVFTNVAEVEKGTPTSTVVMKIDVILEYVMKRLKLEGIIINPWGDFIYLTKNMIYSIFVENAPKRKRKRKKLTNMDIDEDDEKALNKAIKFATDAHTGAVRKGTLRPYILHPIEVAQILSSMGADTNLIAAGLLHDTIEDTEITLKDIIENFGEDVAELVNSHTEDKDKIWFIRKMTQINQVMNASSREKMLVLADKVANLRSMYRDFKELGEELWSRFNAPKHLQAWYYSNLMDGFSDMQNYDVSEDIYWEMVKLYKELFVIFLIDEDGGVLYQLSEDSTSYRLNKTVPMWIPFEDEIPKTVQIINRKDAESIVEEWNRPFWRRIENDMKDGTYTIYESTNRNIDITIRNSKLSLYVQDFGEMCKMINGTNEYEFWYTIGEESTHKLLTALRIKYNKGESLSDILTEEFGYDSGPKHFNELCDEMGIKYRFHST